MGMQFDNRGQLFSFITESKSAYETMRNLVLSTTSADECYFQGIQWLGSGSRFGSSTLGRTVVQLNPDRSNLRVTANRTTRFTQKVIAQTYPQSINIEVPVPDRDSGVEAQHTAQVVEDAANVGIDGSSLIQAHRQANHVRCVSGTAGIGLTIRNGYKKINVRGAERTMQDRRLTAYPFHISDLILDPGACEDKHDLCDHDFVIHESAWTADKIARVLGVKLDPDDLQTIGQLQSFKLQINKVSDRTLFESCRQWSKTKGALVYQIHVKGDTDRFDRMYVVIDKSTGRGDGQEMIWVNEDNHDNPFAGNGMPMVLLHGHRRSGSIFSMGEPRMMRDDQVRLNLLETLFFRHIQKMSGMTVMVDKRSLVNGMSQEEAENQYTNRVGGMWWWDSKGPHQRVNPPSIIQTPPPSPLLVNYAERYTDEMQKSVHRSDPNFGETKSHVPDSSFQKAIEEADQVGQVRISEDLTRIGSLATVMVSTDIASVQMQAPSVLGRLHDAGFREDDFSALLRLSPLDIGFNIRVNPSTVRNRGYNARRQDLDSALQLQAISQMDYRMALSAELDTAITQDDKMFASAAQRAALRIMSGEEWEPIPLGDYGGVFVKAFTKAIHDRRIDGDREAKTRLQNAAKAQIQFNLQEQIASDPALALQQQQADQQAAQQAQQQPEPAQGIQPGGSASVGELMAALG